MAGRAMENLLGGSLKYQLKVCIFKCSYHLHTHIHLHIRMRGNTCHIHTHTHKHGHIDIDASSTAQGGGGSFTDRNLIGEVGCCDAWMAERIH